MLNNNNNIHFIQDTNVWIKEKQVIKQDEVSHMAENNMLNYFSRTTEKSGPLQEVPLNFNIV